MIAVCVCVWWGVLLDVTSWPEANGCLFRLCSHFCISEIFHFSIQQNKREGEINIHKAALFSGDTGLLTHHFIVNPKAGRLHPLKT